jgi:hypothetical protein
MLETPNKKELSSKPNRPKLLKPKFYAEFDEAHNCSTQKASEYFNELRLIHQKKSKLSRSKRDKVILICGFLVENGRIKVTE